MDYSNRRGKVTRSHAFYGHSKSSNIASIATGRRQGSSEMINSSNLGLKECNVLNDYDDVINHQYEEPNNIIKNLARSSSVSRRSRNLSNPCAQEPSMPLIINSMSKNTLNNPGQDTESSDQVHFGSLKRQRSNLLDSDHSISHSDVNRIKYTSTLSSKRKSFSGQASSSDNDTDESNTFVPAFRTDNLRDVAYPGYNSRVPTIGSFLANRENEVTDTSPPEPAPAQPGCRSLNSRKSNPLKRSAKSRHGYLNHEKESEPYSSTLVSNIDSQLTDLPISATSMSKPNFDHTLITASPILGVRESRLSSKYAKNGTHESEINSSNMSSGNDHDINQSNSEAPPPYHLTTTFFNQKQTQSNNLTRNNNLMSNFTGPNSTTGPMLPAASNVYSSHVLEASHAPIIPRLTGYSYSSRASSASAFANIVSSRFGINWSKNCSTERESSIWRLATVVLTLLSLLFLTLLIYKHMSTDTLPSGSNKPCVVFEESSFSTSSSYPSFTSSSTSQRHHESLTKDKPFEKGLTNSPNMFQLNRQFEFLNDSFKPINTINLPKAPSLFSLIKFESTYELLIESIDGYNSWAGYFDQPEPGFVRFQFKSLPIWSRLAFFARKTTPPTLTRYDILEYVNADKTQGVAKVKGDLESDHKSQISISFVKYFESGSWFMTLINDEEVAIPLVLNISKADDLPILCPNNCNGHGKCHQGKCHCFPGHIGQDCKDSVCPVLCSGHGRYLGGKCHCEIGWKGAECNVRLTDCEVADCNGHGQCYSGTCVCLPGYKGDNCEQTDCLDLDCSSHGACIEGKCWCKMGWKGINCSEIDHRLNKFFPHCSSKGVYDIDSDKCVCFKGWLGDDCSIRRCKIDCGLHGTCEGGQCTCDQGWEGTRCDRKKCDLRCNQHGQCSNGTCICLQGWMGKYCTIEGCPFGCSNHGQCLSDVSSELNNEAIWRCICKEGWTGKDCSFPLETNCKDGEDNDNDGLIDCADSECCSRTECKDSLMCLSSPDPLDILLRKPPPSVTASFFQKIKFLIEEGSVQSYAHRDEYLDSRASVIRGQIVTPDGNGLTGIRISVATDPHFGFTLTRPDGWFDILVNGGSMITLQFQRNPFHPIKRTLMVPWNEIVVIQNPILMSAGSEDTFSSDPYEPELNLFEGVTNRTHCWDHDYQNMRPLLFETLRSNTQNRVGDQSSIIGESQILREVLSITGSDLKLVHQSSSSPGYLSTINLQLTPSVIPNTLNQVVLRIVIEGSLFQKHFAAEPNIKYSFAWNKRNVYRQKVYGLTNARVYTGYEYKNCPKIIWSTLTTKVQGFDMEISELASWNLDVHHRYNFHQGVLQKGDGSVIFFKQQSRVASLLIGTGEPRSHICQNRDCDKKLLSPISLTSGPEGSVYVGDAGLIRQIRPDGTVRTIFKHRDKNGLRGTHRSTTFNYHIHFSSFNGHLYISDPEKHQIWRIKSLDNINNFETNYEVVIGSGIRCLPRDSANCGDGGSALEAYLSFPKGLSFGLDGTLYFADGIAIRSVNRKGIINTIIGDNSHHQRRQWKPIPCNGTLSIDQVKLRWPTEIAIHPIDGTLYFLDDQMLFSLTSDKRVMVVVGTPSYCKDHKMNDKNLYHHLRRHHLNDIGSIITFAFGPNGELYVGSIDNDGVNAVSQVSRNGHLIHFMGINNSAKRFSRINQRSFCDVEMCKDLNAFNCTCALPSIAASERASMLQPSTEEQKVMLAKDTPLISITSITVTSDGVVHVADEGTFKIISAVSFLPKPDKQLQFNIVSPETNELYIFNKYGQHIITKNVLTGQILYNFLYDATTSFGKLSSVTDAAGSKVSFLRDSGNSLHSIETATGQKCQVVVNNQGLLETFIDPDQFSTKFSYNQATGLILSRIDSSGFVFFYRYSSSGRLISVTKPSGLLLSIKFDFNQFGSSLKVIEHRIDLNERLSQTELFSKTSKASAIVTNDGNQFEVTLHDDKSIDVLTKWKKGIIWESAPHQALLSINPIQAGMFPILTRQINFHLSPSNSLNYKAASDLALINWDYDLKMIKQNYNENNFNKVAAVERILFINNTRFFSIEYDRHANREILYNNSRRPFLAIQYDNFSRPIQWLPTETRLPLNVIYDRYGRLAGWQQGPIASETFLYDRNGFLSEIRYPDMSSIKYQYDENSKTQPSKITLRSGRQYIYQYNEHSGLEKIITPRKNEHRFLLVISLGSYKLIYTPPGYSDKSNYVIYFDDNQRLLMEIFPDDQSRIFYEYNERSLLTEVVYGGGKISRHYHTSSSGSGKTKKREEDNLIQTETWQEGSIEITLHYQYLHSLVIKSSLRISSLYSQLSNFEFTYNYDEFGRKRLITAKLISLSSSPSISLPSFEFTYDPKAGRLKSIGKFNLYGYHDFQHHQNESIITDGTATFSKVFNSATHQMQQLALTINDKEVYKMDFGYNSNGAIVSTKIFISHLGANRVRVSNYSYDYDQQLVQVSGSDHWHFSYNENGNLVNIQYMQNRIEVLYDTSDRIVSLGKTPYLFNARGCVIQRGEERFVYNNFGQLTRAVRADQYDIKYFYDAKSRLIVRKDNLGNLTQYFYGDIERPHLITHMFNNANGDVTSIIYDESQVPIMAQVNHQSYYIACDHLGSPVLIYDQSGNVVKEINRGPYGHVLFDSNPRFYIPIGFQGGIPDPITGIVHFYGSYIYDSLVGQWLIPNWAQVLTNLKDPSLLSLYRFSKNNPINSITGNQRSSKLNLNQWIQHQGIDLTGFDIGGHKLFAKNHFNSKFVSSSDTFKTASYFNALFNVPQLITSSLQLPSLPLISSFWCSMQKRTESFASISFIQKSRVKSEELLQTLPITKLATQNIPFGYGITLSKVDGRAIILSSADADSISRDVYTKVYNNSYVLDIKLNLKGQEMFYFVKTETRRVDEDILQLQRLGNRINLTTYENQDDQDKTVHQIDVRVHTIGAILNLRYGTTFEREKARILRHAKKYAVSERWAQERLNILHNQLLDSDHRWNETERKLILTTGSVPGYRGEYYHSVEKYFKLADDKNNIFLTRHSKRRQD